METQQPEEKTINPSTKNGMSRKQINAVAIVLMLGFIFLVWL